MLLTITTTHRPATDLGYLLYKHPERVQDFSLAFGKAHVFYPEASAERCTVALLLDIDPIGLVRGRKGQHGSDGGLLTQYVNDRPYVASSFLSVALARVFRSASSSRIDFYWLHACSSRGLRQDRPPQFVRSRCKIYCISSFPVGSRAKADRRSHDRTANIRHDR